MSQVNEVSKDFDTLRSMPTFLTVDELAKVLRVNRNTAYDAVNRGDVPGVVKLGRCIRICRDAVLRWLRGKNRVVHSPRRGK